MNLSFHCRSRSYQYCTENKGSGSGPYTWVRDYLSPLLWGWVGSHIVQTPGSRGSLGIWRQVPSPKGDPKASPGCAVLFLFHSLPTFSNVFLYFTLVLNVLEIEGGICPTLVGVTEGRRAPLPCYPQWGCHGVSWDGHQQRTAEFRSILWRSLVVVTAGSREQKEALPTLLMLETASESIWKPGGIAEGQLEDELSLAVSLVTKINKLVPDKFLVKLKFHT